MTSRTNEAITEAERELRELFHSFFAQDLHNRIGETQGELVHAIVDAAEMQKRRLGSEVDRLEDQLNTGKSELSDQIEQMANDLGSMKRELTSRIEAESLASIEQQEARFAVLETRFGALEEAVRQQQHAVIQALNALQAEAMKRAERAEETSTAVEKRVQAVLKKQAAGDQWLRKAAKVGAGLFLLLAAGEAVDLLKAFHLWAP